MIASLRGLAILGAAVLALAIALIASVARTPGEVDRALLPGFADERVTGLAWPGAHVVRDPASSTKWSWVARPGEADARAIDDVLATLRGARWHREGDPGPVTTTLDVEGLGVTIGLGARLGDEQQWLAVGDRHLLVDAHVARALFPAPLALRIRDPLARASLAKTIAIDGVELHGFPRRLGPILLDPERAARIEQALVELVVVGIPAEPVTPGPHAIALDGVTVLARGDRPCADAGTVAVTGARIGPACVRAQALAALDAEVAPLRTPSPALIDPRPAPIEPTKITLDGAELDLAKRAKLGDADADPARVAELLLALQSPGERIAPPAKPPLRTLVVTGRDTAITLRVYPDRVVARDGEPAAIRVADAAHAILVRPASAYHAITLWTEEPSTIRSVTVGGTTYTRGAALGEWSARADLVEPLAELLARPEPLGTTTAPRAPVAVTMSVVAPAGPPRTHKLSVARTAGGCAATADGQHVLLAPRVCDLVEQLARP